MIRAAVALLALVWLAGGCAYREADPQLTRRFTWFSYLNGDDIRARCDIDKRPRYRFVYNGVYTRQVRTYDIAADASGAGFLLTARAFNPFLLSSIEIDVPGLLSGQDPSQGLQPWAGTKAKVPLADHDLDALDAALAVSGFFRPPPEGARLSSDGFYWIGVACIGGRVVFNAYAWPSSRFDDAAFPAMLFDWDQTGVAVEPPRERPFSGLDEDPQSKGMHSFTITIGRDGLAGTGTLL